MSNPLMTFTEDPTLNQHVQAWQNLNVDEQLALFYFIYKEMGGSITPAAPGAGTVSEDVAQGVFDQVKEMSQEDQLQLQRDLIGGKDTLVSREYGSMSDTTKLLFWYQLAQGMDQGTIVPMPSDYSLSSEAEDLLNKVKGLEYNQQITLFRDYISPMGAEPKAGAEV